MTILQQTLAFLADPANESLEGYKLWKALSNHLSPEDWNTLRGYTIKDVLEGLTVSDVVEAVFARKKV